MPQNYSGFLDCVKSVSVSDVAGGNACMVKNGYDASVYTVDQAITLAKSQLVFEIEHPRTSTDMSTAIILAAAVLLGWFVYAIVKSTRATLTTSSADDELPSVESQKDVGLNRWNIHNDTYKYFQ